MRDPSDRGNAPATGPLPAIALPKGGGAIRGIGEKFSANPITGTGSFTVPLAVSPGRSGFTPQLDLSYDSGAGNSPFGWGFSLGLPAITRKTDKGLPQYSDADESDTFILSGAEDLVPVLIAGVRHRETRTLPDGTTYVVQRYRPRLEGLFSRIERWVDTATGATHWRSISKDNITTLYGRTAAARVADPDDPARVFSWHIEESRDDKGNIIAYEYKPEDAGGVDLAAPFESNRLRLGGGFANRHIKRIRYGNRVPFQADAWLFTVVFDYGDHDDVVPRVMEDRPWAVRPDAFSSHRAGFEVRTYRLCRRALMFHHFPEDLGAEPLLVRSLELDHGGGSPIASFIKRIIQRGYLRERDGSYRHRALPPVELAYTEALIDETVHELDPSSLENLPVGLGAGYQFVDLYNEGLPGILTDQAGAWFYKANWGEGKFGPLQRIAEKPNIADLNRGQAQILDLDADGRNEVAQFQQPVSGYHAQRDDGRWGPFSPFRRAPNINWNDPDLRFIDLTGDGCADILITEEQTFTWYPSEGKEGFGPAQRVHAALDEARGPRLIFSGGADGAEAIYLADMSGDGLVDLVRVRNSEVCYWPNLGYGRFGARVTMGGSTAFDSPDQFSQKRVRLADVDGSGTTDIIYLGQDEVRIHFNQSGNSLSEPRVLTSLPRLDNAVSVVVLDLLGNGTAALVFSSPLPAESLRPLRYVDLMGGQKPHLLRSVVNNLGAETHVRYAASTRFYLADLRADLSWITRIPFPVHVIERVETLDAVSQIRFVTRYAYHHGHYDGSEREFRGFGLVEQWDTEEFAALQADGLLPPASNDSDPASHVPPVRSRTWFHTGVYQEGSAVSRQFAREYYRKPNQSDEDFQALLLDDTVLPAGLSHDEEQEACRALRGSILRQEIYGEDGSDRAVVPYTVSERNYTIEVLQRRGGTRHAVFLVHPRETINYHYERNPDDPRIGHELVLAVDDFGNIRRSAAIGYGRRPALALPGSDGKRQTQLLCTCMENEYTNFVDQTDSYRGRVPAQSSTYELTGLDGAPGVRLSFEQVDQGVRDAATITYETAPTSGLQKRLIERVRMLYRKDDLSGPLPHGQVEPLGLPHESYKLALTPGLIQQVYGGRVTDSMLTGEGRYVHSEGDADWWLPSGQVFYSPGEADPPTELAQAKQHFFLPRRARDPFGQTSTIVYDRHDLLPREARDPLGNVITAEPDYRVLQPWRVTDPNRNRTAVRFDELGMVVATALMGKEGADEGDTLDDPTTRLEYNLLAWMDRRQPVFVHTFAREQHGPQNPRWQEAYSYSDGLGREIQKKIQAEPGPLVEGASITSPRWVGSGWTIFNNKGKPVRQYEPFFSATADFESARLAGVSSILFYDAAERVVATLHPNHTYEKVVFDPWQQVSWDVNDTVLQDPKSDPEVGSYFPRLAASEYRPTWHEARKSGGMGAQEQAAAAKAAAHADTPTIAHFDSLGRTFLTLADNGPDGKYATRVELDIEGNQREVRDARDRAVMRYDHDMLGTRIHQASMEAGERWMLSDVAGNPIYGWDSRGHVLRTSYDALRRPTEVHLSEGGAAELLVERTVYGEGQPDPEARNLRGQAYQIFDGAGVVTSEAYDFKGNILQGTRQLAVEYRKTLDWSADVPLEERRYQSSTTYDALNRPVAMTTPDQSVIRPAYNEANLLERLEGNLRGTAQVTTFVRNLDYNAKGQRELIEYGNGAQTVSEYDSLTFRLTRLRTTRPADDEPTASQLFHSASVVQDLRYVYDPAGNLTRIEDTALRTVVHANQRVEPVSSYTYDAIYRLIEARGREHIGQTALDLGPIHHGRRDYPFVGSRSHPNDLQALRNYTERYKYDAVGNFEALRHIAAAGDWTRRHAYEERSLLEPDKTSNRLSRTTHGGHDGQDEPYTHDIHGNITSMPHLPSLEWDFEDQLQRMDLGAGGTAHYVYDAAGQRVRKVVESERGVRRRERIYLGDFEIYREFSGDGATVALERETLHVMDDKQRIALVETQTVLEEGPLGAPRPLQRFQLGNHLGSASVELAEDAALISYEEYHPYGTTALQAGRSAAEVSLKRYRYIGKERDEETGFNYHGARYYAPWLGRWTSPDPASLADGGNLYVYVRANPVTLTDRRGTQSEVPDATLQHLELKQPEVRTGAERFTDHVQSQLSESMLKNLRPGYHESRLDQKTWRGLAEDSPFSRVPFSPPGPDKPNLGPWTAPLPVRSSYDMALAELQMAGTPSLRVPSWEPALPTRSGNVGEPDVDKLMEAGLAVPAVKEALDELGRWVAKPLTKIAPADQAVAVAAGVSVVLPAAEGSYATAFSKIPSTISLALLKAGGQALLDKTVNERQEGTKGTVKLDLDIQIIDTKPNDLMAPGDNPIGHFGIPGRPFFEPLLGHGLYIQLKGEF